MHFKVLHRDWYFLVASILHYACSAVSDLHIMILFL